MKSKINPLCDKIAAAAGVHPITVHKLAVELARKLPRTALAK